MSFRPTESTAQTAGPGAATPNMGAHYRDPCTKGSQTFLLHPLILRTKNSATVAALLLFYHNKTVEYFTPVIKKQYRSTQALSYIIYSAMIEAREKGFLNWNWGGTWSSQSGVYDFKKKWGTKDNHYYYYIKISNKELLKSTIEILENEYYGFYTIPYNMLNVSEEE